MLHKEIITVYYENHTKPINVFYGENAELLIIKQVVRVITSAL